jgi:hypothetical protein
MMAALNQPGKLTRQLAPCHHRNLLGVSSSKTAKPAFD